MSEGIKMMLINISVKTRHTQHVEYYDNNTKFLDLSNV